MTVPQITGTTLTTDGGVPLDDNQITQTPGVNGPNLLQDWWLIEKLARANRERIPERITHAKGTGAYGVLEITADIKSKTKADFLQQGRKTEAFVRLSNVTYERGSADTIRDHRGFAVKLYTNHGICDLVNFAYPVFSIRDGYKYSDLIHAVKKDPKTNLPQVDMFFDFFGQVKESLPSTVYFYSKYSLPNGFTNINGYGVHTFILVNEAYEHTYVRWKFVNQSTDTKKWLSPKEAAELAGLAPDYAVHDLHDRIEKNDFPTWKLQMQFATAAQLSGSDFKDYSPFDATKEWPKTDAYKWQDIGTLTLNRNPENYFEEVEQSGFSPHNLVPGLAASPDHVLQSRLFAYADTQRYRIGPNYMQLKVNAPKNVKYAQNQNRDGPMNVFNGGVKPGSKAPYPNYEPTQDKDAPTQVNPAFSTWTADAVSGKVGRFYYPTTVDLTSAYDIFNSFPAQEQDDNITNMALDLSKVDNDKIVTSFVTNVTAANAAWGERLSAAIVHLKEEKKKGKRPDEHHRQGRHFGHYH
ncbi:hypothetical protein DFQ28_009839 [Apophysomyces sp. BC1034]|nr:hypothetical protein DFQ30_009482 [Apophysomyces sp. BC1015]KAG0172326.1 hypothetical protein DFQ29_008427 [Apophysomyces sp. BC1021]KAG0185176.1 hypothetical protein DFQ28_009839 [Apophysomyces sp. BC1034]